MENIVWRGRERHRDGDKHPKKQSESALHFHRSPHFAPLRFFPAVQWKWKQFSLCTGKTAGAAQKKLNWNGNGLKWISNSLPSLVSCQPTSMIVLSRKSIELSFCTIAILKLLNFSMQNFEFSSPSPPRSHSPTHWNAIFETRWYFILLVRSRMALKA